ncbi:hypothetical protein IAR50_006184 [Cryptococcus sp. DSM 104548]
MNLTTTPLPVERSQGSVSALVARFQTAANRDQEAATRDTSRRTSLGPSGLAGLTSPILSASSGAGGVSGLPGGGLGAVSRASDVGGKVTGNAGGSKKEEVERTPAAASVAPPKPASPVQPPKKDAPIPTPSPTEKPTCPRKSTSSTLPTPSQSSTPSAKPSALGRSQSVKQPSTTSKRLTPSHTGATSRTVSSPASHILSPPQKPRDGSMSPAPLNPQLTGTPSKPTASFLAKAKSPPARASSAMGGEGRKSSVGSREGVKSPRSSLGRSSGAAVGPRTSASDHPEQKEENEKKSSVRSSSGSRLMQGTAASRARAAANAAGALPSSTVKSPPTKARPRVSSNHATAKHTPDKSSATKPSPSASIPTSSTVQGKDAEKPKPTLGPGSRMPKPRLGLAAARERKTGDEIEAEGKAEEKKEGFSAPVINASNAGSNKDHSTDIPPTSPSPSPLPTSNTVPNPTLSTAQPEVTQTKQVGDVNEELGEKDGEVNVGFEEVAGDDQGSALRKEKLGREDDEDELDEIPDI